MDLGNYRAIKLIGEGAYGRVFEGVIINTGVSVVIKLIKNDELDYEALDMLDDEVAFMKKLSDENAEGSQYIVRYIDDFDYIVDNHLHRVIIMENLTTWATLDQFINVNILADSKNPRIPTYAIDIIIGNLLKGLEYIHQNGVAHRDIKLENIMIDGSLNIKYIDLGLVCSYKCGKRIAGTPLYMPIEILNKDLSNYPTHNESMVQHNLQIEKGHDVWSLGIVIYKLANLQNFPDNFPFYKSLIKTRRDLLRELENRHYVLPSSYKRDYDGPNINILVESMLTLDPSSRPTITQLSKYFFDNVD